MRRYIQGRPEYHAPVVRFVDFGWLVGWVAGWGRFGEWGATADTRTPVHEDEDGRAGHAAAVHLHRLPGRLEAVAVLLGRAAQREVPVQSRGGGCVSQEGSDDEVGRQSTRGGRQRAID